MAAVTTKKPAKASAAPKTSKAGPKSSRDGYTGADIDVLEGIAAVRRRPGMYIGSTDEKGRLHLIWEILDNAVDEALAGHASQITVTIHADNSVSVDDDGRGIPVDVNPKTGRPAVTLVLTELHAGGKFGNSGYKVSGGLHGVGASVVNALSEKFVVEVDRDGYTWRQEFKEAVPGVDRRGKWHQTDTLTKVKKIPKNRTGTRIRFWVDERLFTGEKDWPITEIHTRCRRTAHLVAGLSIRVVDERESTPEELSDVTFRSAGGVRDYVTAIVEDHNWKTISPIVTVNGEGTYTEAVPVTGDDGEVVVTDTERTCVVDAALVWCDTYDTHIESAVNIVITPKGGTHVAGFERAVTRVVNEAISHHKVGRQSDPAAVKDDVQEGLVAVVTVRMAEPQFIGQTKEELGSAPIQSIVYQTVASSLRQFFTDPKRKTVARRVLNKTVSAVRARVEAKERRETVRRKSALEGGSNLPAKLKDCASRDRNLTELLIVEGDSALGTAVAARSSEYQALLPIRGKILNTAKARESEVLKNAECAAIIAAIGAGSGKSFDLEQARYGRLIALVDADVDGAHIRTLLLTLVYNFMRPLLEAGRVFCATPPLYRLFTTDGEVIDCLTDADRERVTAELAAEGRRIREGDTQRFKGLGEMDADQLAETVMNPLTRTLRRVTVEDAAAAARAFEVLMGKDVPPRREFITDHADDLDDALLDI